MNKPEIKFCNESNNSIASDMSEKSDKKKNNKFKNKKLSVDSIATNEEDSIIIKSENGEEKKNRKDSNKSCTDESNLLLDTEDDNLVDDDDEEYDVDDDASFKNYENNNWQSIDQANEIIYNNSKTDVNNLNGNSIDLKWSSSNLNNNVANHNNKFSSKKKALPGN